jgi:nitrate reductase molybdenum cofactor assembly chaperone NarJ/NarW
MSTQMISFKALGALLTYPDRELRAALPEISAALAADGTLEARQRAALAALMEWMQSQDPLDLEESYVDMFDRGRSTSLYLFEHVHGESRDRGQAMVDLKAQYARAGLSLDAHELPDFLPAVLEYLSLQPIEVARDMLEDCAPILRALGRQLQKRQSPYACVLDAVLALAGETGIDAGAAVEAPQEKSLDEEWAEEPVIFGTGAKPCAPARKPQFVPRREAQPRTSP